jgi:hypothetical protein
MSLIPSAPLQAGHTATSSKNDLRVWGGLVIETRSLPNLLVATLATLPSMLLIPSAPLKLVRCPRSLTPILVALPSMSLIPSVPFPICGNRTQCVRCNREKILLRQRLQRDKRGGAGQGFLFPMPILLSRERSSQARRHFDTRTYAREILKPYCRRASIITPSLKVTARRERLMIPESTRGWLGNLERFAILWRPGFTGLHRRAFHLSNRDHFPGVRFGQFAPAGEAAAFADLSQIFANVVLSFFHFFDPSAGVAAALQFNGLNHAS